MILTPIIKFWARAVKARTVPFSDKLLQAEQNQYDFEVRKQHSAESRAKPDQLQLDELARVRLSDQHMPKKYLKRVQQVFGKYDAAELRNMADMFSQSMNLQYKQKKLNFSNIKPFIRLQPELSPDRRVQKIVLRSKQSALKQIQNNEVPKEDENPIGVKLNYTQNIVVSYLLKRVPRTFATAVRIFTQIQFKYPNFKPKSMIDYGSGLSSGSYAFCDIFGESSQVYNVEPNQKMFKLSKFLSQDYNILHFKALGELSRTVKDVQIVYAGYVLNQIQSSMIPLYAESLYSKVRKGGFLVIAQYGNPYGARLIHDLRNWAISNKINVVLPCPHMNKCPLADGNRWCHFDQPAGSYPRSIFGKLPTEHATQLEKFCYLVLHKPLDEGQDSLETVKSKMTADWDRIIFNPMKRGGHVILEVCTKQGRMEKRIVAKSHGDEFKEARSLKWGDLWRFEKRIPNKFRKEHKKGKRLW